MIKQLQQQKPVRLSEGWLLDWDNYGFLLIRTRIGQSGAKEGQEYVDKTFFYPSLKDVCEAYIKKLGLEANTLQEMLDKWMIALNAIATVLDGGAK